MNFEDIFNETWENLPDSLLDNKSLEEIKRQILDLVSTFNEKDKNNYSFRIREDILGVIDFYENDKIFVIEEKLSELFGLEFGEDKLFFSIRLTDEIYNVTFMWSRLNKYNHDTVINLVIDSDKTLWDILSVVKDNNEYYYDYKREYFSMTCDNKLVIDKDVEEKKDRDFSEFFGIPMKEVRGIRLNFSKNRDLINKMLASKDMKYMDNIYSNNNIVFDEPFSINELSYIILGSELIQCDYESRKRLEKVVNNIFNYIGNKGEIVVTHNLIMNIQSYVYLDYDILDTTGYIVRKIDNEYIIFNVNISHNSILVIPSNITRQDLISLYNSSGNSEHSIQLDEFFGVANIKKLESKD